MSCPDQRPLLTPKACGPIFRSGPVGGVGEEVSRQFLLDVASIFNGNGSDLVKHWLLDPKKPT